MIKVGKIPFLNLMPIFYYLERHCSDRYSFLTGVPSEVNNYLRKGMVDLSPSSSIEYLKGRASYRLIPGHSISSIGAVNSIYLFTNTPLDKMKGKNILYTYKSETSTALLKVICEKFYGLCCHYEPSDITLSEGLEIASGYLLIGDEAMIEFKNNTRYYIYDLGELWYRETGLPFVFALWIVRPDVEAETVDTIKKDLDRARSWAMEHLEEMAHASELTKVLGKDFIIQYWQSLSYDLDKQHLKGLELFNRYLVDLKLLK